MISLAVNLFSPLDALLPSDAFTYWVCRLAECNYDVNEATSRLIDSECAGRPRLPPAWGVCWGIQFVNAVHCWNPHIPCPLFVPADPFKQVKTKEQRKKQVRHAAAGAVRNVVHSLQHYLPCSHLLPTASAAAAEGGS